ncbi:hypothetical protein DENSPDRAFT_909740, partial [Dentipellis sp. KUC8613]
GVRYVPARYPDTRKALVLLQSPRILHPTSYTPHHTPYTVYSRAMASNILTTLTIGGQIASAVPGHAFGISGLIGAAKVIVDLLEAVDADREACRILSARTSRLVTDIVERAKVFVDRGPLRIPTELGRSVADLEKCLKDIQKKLSTASQGPIWRRVVHRNRNYEMILECTSLLDEAWRKLDTAILIYIRQLQQEILQRQKYDVTHRIFRLCDFRLLRRINPIGDGDDSHVEEGIGEMMGSGKQVVLRRLRPGVNINGYKLMAWMLKVFWDEVQKLKKFWHSNLVQLLGYSQRQSRSPFCVLYPVSTQSSTAYMYGEKGYYQWYTAMQMVMDIKDINMNLDPLQTGVNRMKLEFLKTGSIISSITVLLTCHLTSTCLTLENVLMVNKKSCGHGHKDSMLNCMMTLTSLKSSGLTQLDT